MKAMRGDELSKKAGDKNSMQIIEFLTFCYL
jgi:hypothetical protein